MSDKWQPPLPHCLTLMRARDNLTIRDTPSALGRKMSSIPAGMVVRVDKGDYCLLYGTTYRYIRLVSWSNVAADEPLYIVWQEVTEAGVTDWLVPHRDDCDDTPEPPDEPDIPEIPEDELTDFIELEFKKLNAVLPWLHNKLGNEQFKARLTPELMAVFQEVIVGATTPDVPPVEEPEIPPVEEEPTTPPVVEPPVAREPKTAPWHVSNGQIFKNNKLWKGIILNYRELPFYGTSAHPQAEVGHIFQQLDFAVSTNAEVVRVYCAHPTHSAEQAIPLIRRVLDECQKRKLSAILCLSDAAPPGSFYIADDAPNRRPDGGYSWAFIQGGYRNRYWEYVDKVTKAFTAHPAIWMWESFNEMVVPTHPLTGLQADAMFDMFKQIGKLIKGNSPTKMLGNGKISSWQTYVFDAYGGKQLARKEAMLPEYDVVCFHSYAVMDYNPNPQPRLEDVPQILGDSYQHILDELNAIKGTGKAFILEETATKWENTEVDKLRIQASAFFELGGSAVGIWGVGSIYDKDINAHGGGYFNDAQPPQSTRWHNTFGWVKATGSEFKRVLGYG